MKRKARVAKDISELKKIVSQEDSSEWQIPNQSLEIRFRGVKNLMISEDMKKIQMSVIRDKMVREGYVEIDNIDHVQKIFSGNIESKLDKFYLGAGAFFVWKHSALLSITDDKKKKDDLIEKMTEAQAATIMQYLKGQGILRCQNFFNHLGEKELSNSGRLNVRDAKGKVIFTIQEGQKRPYPQRRNIDIEDMSLSVLKIAMKKLDIKIK